MLNISNNDNINKNKEVLFLFNRFMINNYKIAIMIKSKIAFVGIFSLKSSRGFQNLLLIHLYISLINFKGDSITKLHLINNYINNSNKIDCFSFQEFRDEKNDEINNSNIKGVSKMDFLELSIYDNYFLKSCIIHFENVFNILTKREDINLTFTKFLDLYIIDISSENLLFDLNEIINSDLYYNNMSYKYYKVKNIYKEILFHSHQLNDSYISKYGSRFIKGDTSQRFIKVECTSTYPRILFIIKFIPVLKGIIIVHVYYQSKLSRGNNNISMNHENKYKEVDLVFGSFFGENGEMDLKYIMPKKLGNIVCIIAVGLNLGDKVNVMDSLVDEVNEVPSNEMRFPPQISPESTVEERVKVGRETVPTSVNEMKSFPDSIPELPLDSIDKSLIVFSVNPLIRMKSPSHVIPEVSVEDSVVGSVVSSEDSLVDFVVTSVVISEADETESEDALVTEVSDAGAFGSETVQPENRQDETTETSSKPDAIRLFIHTLPLHNTYEVSILLSARENLREASLLEVN